MKYKYLIFKNDETNELKITEYANLDNELKKAGDFNPLNIISFSLLCVETYDSEAIKFAISEGKKSLISSFRTHKMYPPSLCADKIAESIIELYRSGHNGTSEIIFDEKESLINEERKHEDSDVKVHEDDEGGDDVPVEIDDLLKEDIEIEDMNAPLRIEEEELFDDEE